MKLFSGFRMVSWLYLEPSWRKSRIQPRPMMAFLAAGRPLRGIRLFFRVGGALLGSVPGGISKSVVSIQRR